MCTDWYHQNQFFKYKQQFEAIYSEKRVSEEDVCNSSLDEGFL